MDDSMDRSSFSDEQDDTDLMEQNGDEYEDGTEQSENDQSNEYGSDDEEQSDDGNDDKMDDDYDNDDADAEGLGQSNSTASLNDGIDDMKQDEHNLFSSVEAAKDVRPLEFAAAELAADISAKFPAVKNFFTQQLRTLLVAFNEHAAPAEAENWFVVVNNRSGALSLNMLDVWYINSGLCKKARSRVEVALMSNFAPAVKQSQKLPSEVLYLAARENRERLLISQALIGRDSLCTDIKYENELDSLHFTFADGQSYSTCDQHSEDTNRTFFGLGNTVVLNWGKVVDWTGFHTKTQIYPVGFKCLRQEHDICTDRIVDICCEIVAVPFTMPKDGAAQSSLLPESAHLRPWFRLTVMWDLSTAKQIVRTYEGPTPQEAWQGIMLESLGTNRQEIPLDTTELLCGFDNVKETVTHMRETDPIDDEEKVLRCDLVAARAKYLRCLRSDQRKGFRRAIQPRIPVEAVDNIFDEYLLRIVEGMQGSTACNNYVFIDGRVHDSSGNSHKNLKVNYIKYVTGVLSKYKHMERIIRKNLTLRILEEREIKEKEKLVEAELKKKEKEDMKASKMQRQVENALKRHKLKEVEKLVRSIRGSLIVEVKKRRDDARVRVEALVENEKSSNSSTITPTIPAVASGANDVIQPVALKNRGFRPQPSSGLVSFSGDAFGKLIEFWGLYVSLSSALDVKSVPSVRKIESALRVCDPHLQDIKKKLHNSSSTMRYFDVNPNKMTKMDAELLLNEVGVTLCQNLMPDFLRILGIDTSDTLYSGCKFELNSLNWKEVARTVLLWHALKLLGAADPDIMSYIRGRGHTTTPEPPDRRTLKLIKKRLVYNFKEMPSMRRKLHGFTAGLNVRIPTPGPTYKVGSSWQSLVLSLVDIDDSAGWLVKEIITSAVESALIVGEKETHSQRVVNMLLSALCPLYFNADDTRLTKSICFFTLKRFGVSKSRAKPLRITGESTDLPLTAFEMWDEQARSFPTTATSLITTDMYRNIADLALSEAADDGEDRDREDLQEQEQEPITPAGELTPGDKTEFSDAVLSGRVKFESLSEAEMESLQTLSVAMQRCYNTLRALAANEKSVDFIDPVDPKLHPKYYDLVRHPIFLDDIRRCILSGGYKDSIYSFYKDVMIVFENAQIFLSEQSQISQNAHKLAFAFERLFLEMVLCYDSPISFHNTCNFCRELISEGDHQLICERCDGVYHTGCLYLRTVPKGEWTCNNCIQQRDISHVHPYRNAVFSHPKNGKVCEVISVEQIKRNLRFIVLVDGERELFSGVELRKSLSGDAEIKLPSGYTYDDYDAACGLAQGYSGWGKPQCTFYPNDVYSQVALDHRVDDPLFEDLVRSLAVLGFSTSNEDLGYREWIAIFSALSSRIMATTKMESIKFEDQQDMMSTMQSSSGGLDRQQSFENLLEPSRLFANKSAENTSEVARDAETKTEDLVKEKQPKENDINGNNDLDDNNRGDLEDENFLVPASDESFEALLKPEEKWERRRLSRMKGREDALFSSMLMQAVLSEVDFDSYEEDEEDKRERGVPLDAPTALVQLVLRSCTPRPPESLDDSEWLTSLDNKIARLDREDTHDQVLCHFCGLTERDLASSFVLVESRFEWEKEETSATSNLCLQTPYYPEDAAPEIRECSELSGAVVIRQGSLVAHECCAEAVASARAVSLAKQGKMNEKLKKSAQEKEEKKILKLEDAKATDFLNILSRARNLPIGTDREGNTYWILCGSRALYVSSLPRKTPETLSFGRFKLHAGKKINFAMVDEASNSVDDYTEKDFRGGQRYPLAGYGDVGYFSQCLWSVYEDPADLAKLVDWLDRADPQERMICVILKRLFPAVTSITVSPSELPVVLKADDKILLDGIVAEFVASSGSIGVPPELISMISESAAFEIHQSEGAKKRTRDDPDNDGDESVRLVKRSDNSASGSSRLLYESLVEGTKVSVSGGRWKGRITESFIDKDDRLFYKIHFDGWGRTYDAWYNEFDVTKLQNKPSESDSDESETCAVDFSEYKAVEYVTTLSAVYFLYEPDRLRGGRPPPMIPNCKSPLELLKFALLVVEAALPMGAIDQDSEDRWSDDFITVWRDSVLIAGDPTALMACQIMLEYGIKTVWLKPGGNKLLSSLPSRTHSMKFASTGLIALRLSALDQAIKYTKVVGGEVSMDVHSGGSSRGRGFRGGRGKKQSSARGGR